jgi:hypothetical protein
MSLRLRAVAGIGFVCALWVLSLHGQSAETFRARLTAVPADARTRPDLTGSGTVSATLAGTTLTFSGSFEGLKTPVTTANVHAAVAPVAGVRGPAIGDISLPKTLSGAISGSLELNAKQVETLRKGGLYVEIHTEKAPDGALWGWLLKQ